MDELFGEGGCTAGYAARHEVGKEVGDFHCWASSGDEGFVFGDVWFGRESGCGRGGAFDVLLA